MCYFMLGLFCEGSGVAGRLAFDVWYHGGKPPEAEQSLFTAPQIFCAFFAITGPLLAGRIAE